MPDNLPKHHRKGIAVDARANQYVCRVGFHLTADGRRVQAPTKYLSSDPDEATRRHMNLVRQWETLCADWERYRQIIRPGLPESLRGVDLAKPFWIKDEWLTAAEEHWKSDAKGSMQGVVQELIAAAASHVDAIDANRAALARMSEERDLIPTELATASGASEVIPPALLNGKLLDALPADIRARVLLALQPSAAEVTGIAPDAQTLTIRQAADRYLENEKQRVDNKLRGIGPNFYAYKKNMIEGALRLLDANADLRTLTHEKLMDFIIKAGNTAKSPRTAYNWALAGLKPLLEWAHKRRDINYRMPDDIDDIFRLRKPHTETKLTYCDDTLAKLKAIRAASEGMRAESWVFVLLGLNCGAYQADIASWTYDNLKIMKDGKVFIEWQRVKEKHKNQTLWCKHQLWPETWARMQKFMATDDLKMNPERRLFLTRNNEPMWKAAMGKPRVDAIGLRYKRAMAEAYITKDKKTKLPVSLPFKQLRKIGMNAMNQYGNGSLEIVRVYAGHAIPGIDGAYLVNRYDDMNQALAKWRDQLLKDGILETGVSGSK